jgi:hypothetical protein
MNIQHEFRKVMTVVFREDIFYGYEHETKDSYFIQPLNADYCKISSIEDGCYNFAFDFSYFTGSNESKVDMFPSEFKKKYNIYKKDRNKQWQELDPNKTICIKMNEDVDFPLIPFMGVFESLYDIEDFKALEKAKSEIGNYKMLALRIPLDDEGNFKLDGEVAKEYYRLAASVLPANIGLILTPMEITDHSFEKDKVDSDEVAKAERDYWSGAGVSQLLFNSEKSSSATIGNSIKSDEDIVFRVIRSLERWLNRKIKYMKYTHQFRVKLLDVTKYNQQEVFENLLKAAQYGAPTKTAMIASLGYSPLDVINMSILENDILDYKDAFIPLSSSHTMTSEDISNSNGSNESIVSEETKEETTVVTTVEENKSEEGTESE